MNRLVSVLLVCAAVFSAASCGKSGEKAGSGPVTVKFANYALLEAGYEDFWNGVKTGFEKENPDVVIEWVTAPYGDIVNQVINMAGGGDRVDVLFGEIGWTPTMESSGLAVPVDAVLSAEFLDDFYSSQLDACSIDGKAYALPMYVSPFVLYYNKDLFRQAGLDPDDPPKTYDEMLKAAEKISAIKTADGNKVYAFGQTTASVPVSGSSLTAMVYNFGGEVLDKDGNLSVDSEGFRQAFDMLKTLDEKKYNPQNAKLKDLRNLFALGQLAMYYDQSWGYNGVQAINPAAKDFTASAAPLAGGSGNGDSILQAHVLIYMNDSDAKKDALRRLSEYLISADTLSDYLTHITPAYPARKSMSGMASIVQNPILKGAANSVDKTVPVTFVPALSDLNLELCTFAQNMTVGGQPFDNAFPAFKTAAENILK